MENLIPILIVSALVCGTIGGIIGNTKNAPGFGFLLGFLFGPLGVLIACLIDNRAQCPKCRGRIENGAEICPHCRQTLGWYDGAPMPRIERDKPKSGRDSPPAIWPGLFDLPPAKGDNPQRHDPRPTAANDELDDLVVDQFLKPPPKEKPRQK